LPNFLDIENVARFAHYSEEIKIKNWSLKFSASKDKSKEQKPGSGFTLIELLVVIAIIGLLASIVSAAINRSRLKARDARRLTDMQQFKTGFDVFYSLGSGYPDKATFDGAYTGGTTLSCSGTPVIKIVQDPLYPSFQYDYDVAGTTLSGCGGSSNLRNQYTITFILEKTGLTYTMNEDGQFNPALPQL